MNYSIGAISIRIKDNIVFVEIIENIDFI
jgi:hypothetical protein